MVKVDTPDNNLPVQKHFFFVLLDIFLNDCLMIH